MSMLSHEEDKNICFISIRKACKVKQTTFVMFCLPWFLYVMYLLLKFVSHNNYRTLTYTKPKIHMSNIQYL
jgi:hypothetical protein